VALCVEFTLESSTYATMLLRELMKTQVGNDRRASTGVNQTV
jgi:tRNA(Glu) U13 pseudouridine synthase TruD